MFTVAIMGQSGSGKTTLAKKLGVALPNSTVIHGDPLQFEMVKKVLKEDMSTSYSKKVLNDDGTLDTMAMLSDGDNYRSLCKTVDPMLAAEIEKQVAEAKEQSKSFVVFDYYAMWRLLGLWNDADLRVGVRAFPEERKKMLMQRHGFKHCESMYENRDLSLLPLDLVKYDFDAEQLRYLQQMGTDFDITNSYDADRWQDVTNGLAEFITEWEKLDKNEKHVINERGVKAHVATTYSQVMFYACRGYEAGITPYEDWVAMWKRRLDQELGKFREIKGKHLDDIDLELKEEWKKFPKEYCRNERITHVRDRWDRVV